MGDNAEFEHLSAIEVRLAAALDRIAVGISAGGSAEADAARLDAETRATELEERVSALEARLTETQDALSDAQADAASARAETAAQSPGADMAALAALEARLAAAEAARGAAQAELEDRNGEAVEKDAALAEMQTALEAAQTAATQDDLPQEASAEVEDIEKALAVMGLRAERAREERDAARKAADAAIDVADELREATGTTPDERVLDLRRQLRLVRTRAEDLAAQMSLLQSGAGVDASVLDQGLLAEVETLRQLRAADTAELDRILGEMQAGLETTEGGEHA